MNECLLQKINEMDQEKDGDPKEKDGDLEKDGDQEKDPKEKDPKEKDPKEKDPKRRTRMVLQNPWKQTSQEGPLREPRVEFGCTC